MGPGFFGKLPSHGDFVGRHLPPPVRACFDHWLQGALVQSRIELGAAWLPAWLSSPLWRFAISAGVCSEQAWAGVMMPSHDRVGRCFPLLLASAIDGAPSLSDCLTRLDGWFSALEALALSTLEEGFSLELFDAALMALDAAPAAACCVIGDGASPMSVDHLASGQSAWWSEGSLQVAPCVAVCNGMPPPAAFAALLDGRWTERGWDLPQPWRSI